MSSQRRQEARTDETTLSEGLTRNRAMEIIANFSHSTGTSLEGTILELKDPYLTVSEDEVFTKAALGDFTTPLEVLKRTLSVHSVLLTASSFAEHMEAASGVNFRNPKLSEIGKGSFGTVYEIPGTEWCLKKTLRSPTTFKTELHSGKRPDSSINHIAWKSIVDSGDFSDILMPRVPRYSNVSLLDTATSLRWFQGNGHLFPIQNGGQKPGSFIFLERIMPLPRVVRTNLISHYFKPEDRQGAIADPENQACLCRTYLGLKSTEVPSDKREQELRTLKNFPLYLDQLFELNMDPFLIAREMALGLAAGHWVAGINMTDDEFVIGSRPYERPELFPGLGRQHTAGHSDQTLGGSSCSFFIRWATDGPYYPRVLAKDATEWNLWICFAQTYISASKRYICDAKERLEQWGYDHIGEIDKLVMKRPSYIMNAWMKAECDEYGVSSKQFGKISKDDHWPLP
ncbi:Zinc finger protein [Geosmithia morbida]|uniref:Zinc finger protein n=1 Tax=Geosmithia morbida TaxID=1094350 RepID=A0A9P5CZ71_9HYPO|nr:Zinc finger protein [Geosmithia morbida]KAF4120137.1 Zinc finger protein [Geosmithia morbida]